MENKEVLIYDITSIPNQVGLNMQQIFEAYKNHRIVVWDSIDGGVEPKIINIDENSPPPFVVD